MYILAIAIDTLFMFFLFLISVDCLLTEVHTTFVSLILFLILTITIRYIIRLWPQGCNTSVLDKQPRWQCPNWWTPWANKCLSSYPTSFYLDSCPSLSTFAKPHHTLQSVDAKHYLTGGKGSITQWVHVEYMEGSETVCPTFTQWVRGGHFSKVPTKVPTG